MYITLSTEIMKRKSKSAKRSSKSSPLISKNLGERGENNELEPVTPSGEANLIMDAFESERVPLTIVAEVSEVPDLRTRTEAQNPETTAAPPPPVATRRRSSKVAPSGYQRVIWIFIVAKC